MKTNNLTILAILSITFLHLVSACGMTTHIEITNRALHFFKPESKKGIDYKKILMENPSYFTAGSPFPDWGYACEYSELAEAAHWPPFMHSYVNFIQEKYADNPARYNQLISFLFGMESHGMADVSWHWGIETKGADQQGFLHSYAHMTSDCNDDWGNCHDPGDIGGDMYLAYRGGLKWFSKNWDVPLSELSDLYETLDMPVPKEKIESCMLMMFLAAKMEGYASLFELAKDEMTGSFLTDEIDLWFHGGVDDMAVHVAWQWQNIINMLESSDPSSYFFSKSKQRRNLKKFDMKKVMKKIVNKNTYLMYKQMLGVETKQNEFGDLSLSVDLETFNKNKQEIFKSVIKALKPNYTEIQVESILRLAEHPFAEEVKEKVDPKFKLGSTVDRSYFGKSVTYGDFDGDGKMDLAVGAPGFGDTQQGAVYILKNSDYSDIDYTKPQLLGEQVYSRFGFSLTTVDVNHDGIDDLVVSAPIFGPNGPSEKIEDYYPKHYIGKVYVYYGRKGEGIAQNAKADAEITTKDSGAIFFNLGFFLGSGDCDGDGFNDLLIGSPYSQQGGDKRGHAAVFVNITDKSQVYIEDADLFAAGVSNYQEFGYSIACNKDVVVVGAPGYRHEERDYQASGAVYGIDFKKKVIKFTILSDKSQARFGNSIDINSKKHLLAVGAPSYSVKFQDDNYQNGVVFLYSLDKLNLENHIEDYDSVIKSEISRSRFGKNLKFIDGGSLMVSAAFYTTNANIIDNGKVYIYTISEVDKGEHSIDEATKVVESSSNGGRLGDAIAVSPGEAAITAPFTVNNDMRGEVLIFT